MSEDIQRDVIHTSPGVDLYAIGRLVPPIMQGHSSRVHQDRQFAGITFGGNGTTSMLTLWSIGVI